MAVFSPTAYKIIVSALGKLTDAVPVTPVVLMARTLAYLNVIETVESNTPPPDKDVIWYYTDGKKYRAYRALDGNWFDLSSADMGRYFYRRVILGSQTDVSIETGDLFAFWDVSLGATKKVTIDTLQSIFAAFTLTRLAAREIQIDTSAGPVTVTLPASPADKDRLIYSDRKGTFSTINYANLARNGKTIDLSATDLRLNVKDIGVELTYNAATNDWQITRLFRSNTR